MINRPYQRGAPFGRPPDAAQREEMLWIFGSL